MKFKVGDYVETSWACVGVEAGEQGIVIDDTFQDQLQLIFPARDDFWAEEPWRVRAYWLKLLYRPRVKANEK